MIRVLSYLFPRTYALAAVAAGLALAQDIALAPPHTSDPDAFPAAEPRQNVAMFWGRWLQYEVVDGMAVHAGDMVLGPAENFRQPRRRRTVAKERTIPAGSIPRAVSFNKDRLWPEGM